MCSNHLIHDGKYFTTIDKQKTLLKEVTFVPDKIAEEADNLKIEQAIKYGALLGEGMKNHKTIVLVMLTFYM